MNKRITLFSVFMAAASLAYGAMAPVDVTISDASGKVAYKGKTNSAGSFATPKLHSGEYVVQFSSSDLAKGDYALAVLAGKEKLGAEAVPAEKFGKGGVAMKVKVGGDMNVSGWVSTGKVADTASGTKVKVVNGKRWFWVNGSTGSNLGGHWVEEGTPEARNLGSYSKQAVNNLQEKAKGSPNE
jgi:hypothetical protein